MLKYTFKNKIKSEHAEQLANRIKFDPDVFLYLWSRQNSVDVSPFENELMIGDPEAPVRILMAASLGCGPCKKGFEQVIKLLAAYSGSVSLSLRFHKSGNPGKGASSPSDYLLGYWYQYIRGKVGESEQTEQLIRDWYEQQNVNSFMQNYPMKERSMNNSKKLAQKHYRWMEQAEIKTTPTFIVNGRPLPKHYWIGDLMTLAPALAEYFGSKGKHQNDLNTRYMKKDMA